MFEESFAPILLHAIQIISSKTCLKRYTATALQINVIHLPVTMNEKIKKPPVKKNFRRSQ